MSVSVSQCQAPLCLEVVCEVLEILKFVYLSRYLPCNILTFIILYIKPDLRDIYINIKWEIIFLSNCPWWRWWYSVVKISTKTKSNMKICASSSYLSGLKILQRIFLVFSNYNENIWIIKANLQAFTPRKRPFIFRLKKSA